MNPNPRQPANERLRTDPSIGRECGVSAPAWPMENTDVHVFGRTLPSCRFTQIPDPDGTRHEPSQRPCDGTRPLPRRAMTSSRLHGQRGRCIVDVPTVSEFKDDCAAIRRWLSVCGSTAVQDGVARAPMTTSEVRSALGPARSTHQVLIEHTDNMSCRRERQCGTAAR